jgi:predicted PurR-regulated permease PerM
VADEEREPTDPGTVPRTRSPKATVTEPGATGPGGTEATVTEPGAEPSGDGPTVTEPPNRFGLPGRPLTRSPFLIGLTGGLGLLLAYSAFLLVRDALSILILIFIAMFLAVGLNPAVVRLQRWGLPRWLAVAAVGFGVVLLVCGGLTALVPPLITQTTALAENLPGYIEELQRNPTIRDLNARYDVLNQIQSAATSQNFGRLAGGVLGGLQIVFSAIFNVLTVAVLTIYFMAAFERLREGAYKLVPASRRDRVRLIGDEILTKVGAYMAGALAIALIAGASTWVFLVIAGVTYPFALAVVVAITDLIPQVGATIGAVVVTIIAFASASVPVGIACAVFFIIYQQVENYLIYPKVMRRAVKVSDLAAIVAVLIGVALLGIIGALIAIPAVAAIQLIVREVILPRQARN